MNLLKRLMAVSLCLVFVLSLCACNKDDDTDTDITENSVPVVTEEVSVEQVAGFEEKKPENSQIDVIVDSWLKIISIGEKNGVLSVFVRNISDEDIQYALLTVSASGNTVEFPITTLTAGASATLRCSNGYTYDDSVDYYAWKISDKTVFREKLSCHSDVFVIEGADNGYISIKNISKKDIDGNIYIYYKNVTDGIYDDGVTYRATVKGLRKGETKQIRTQHYMKDSSRIMYVEYAK